MPEHRSKIHLNAPKRDALEALHLGTGDLNGASKQSMQGRKRTRSIESTAYHAYSIILSEVLLFRTIRIVPLSKMVPSLTTQRQ